MEIRFTRSIEDVVDVIRRTSMPVWVVSVLIVLSATLFVEGIYLVNHGFYGGYFWPAVAVLLALACYEAPRFQARRAMRRPSAQGEITFSFQDDGVSVTGPNGKAHLLWRAFSKFEETERMFFLSSTSGSLRSIPKRAMSSEQIIELRRILELRIPSKPN